MKAYKAPHVVYQGGKLVPAGEVFATDAAKGDGWEEVKGEEAPKPAPDKAKKA